MNPGRPAIRSIEIADIEGSRACVAAVMRERGKYDDVHMMAYMMENRS